MKQVPTASTIKAPQTVFLCELNKAMHLLFLTDQAPNAPQSKDSALHGRNQKAKSPRG
jgi:hypothetical protein